jgi:hypothetical protein
MAGGDRRPIRATFPRTAAGSADRDTAGPPALFPGAGQGRPADACFRRCRQYRESRTGAGAGRQRARGAAAATGTARRPASRRPRRATRAAGAPGAPGCRARRARSSRGAAAPASRT